MKNTGAGYERKMWNVISEWGKKKKKTLTARQERNLLILLSAQSEHEDFPERRNNSFNQWMGEQVETQ